MKLRFYIDLWPGLLPAQYGLQASTAPLSPPPENGKRVAFDVAIPDHILDAMYGTTEVSPEVSAPEIVPEHKE